MIMASTQNGSAIWTAETFTASSTHADSAVQTVNTGYGASLSGSITNAATGPTIPLGLQIEVSLDGTNYEKYGGPIIAGVANNGVYPFSKYFSMGEIQKWRITPHQNNTVQDVTVNLFANNVAAVS